MKVTSTCAIVSSLVHGIRLSDALEMFQTILRECEAAAQIAAPVPSTEQLYREPC